MLPALGLSLSDDEADFMILTEDQIFALSPAHDKSSIDLPSYSHLSSYVIVTKSRNACTVVPIAPRDVNAYREQYLPLTILLSWA